MAVLRLTMGLLPLPGLPVPSLGFPVNPESPQAAAPVRTIGLAPPAPPAHEEPHAAPSAMNLDQEQSGLQPCKQSEAVIEIWCLWGFRSFSETLRQSPKLPLRAFFFIPSNVRRNQHKGPSCGRAGVGQNGERFYWWVITVSTGGSFQMSKGSEGGRCRVSPKCEHFAGWVIFYGQGGSFQMSVEVEDWQEALRSARLTPTMPA